MWNQTWLMHHWSCWQPYKYVRQSSQGKIRRLAAFIDFFNAHDRIDGDLLWHKLLKMSISGKYLASLQSFNKNVKCTVCVNDQLTDWFDVNCGLR